MSRLILLIPIGLGSVVAQYITKGGITLVGTVIGIIIAVVMLWILTKDEDSE